MRVKPSPRATHRVGGLVVLLIVASVVGAGLPGLTASSPVNLDDEVEQLDEEMCSGEYTSPGVSEACADWVNKCCYALARQPSIDIAAGPNGERVYVFGLEGGFPLRSHIAAIEPGTGTTLWQSSLPWKIRAMDVNPDGSRVFATTALDGRITAIAYDSSSGEQLWTASHVGTEEWGAPLDIVVGPTGTNVYVTGKTSNGEPTWIDVTTVAFDATTGSELWARNHDGPSDVGGDVGRSIEVSPDGSHVIVTGNEQNETTYTDWVTIGYNATTGVLVWKDVLDGDGEQAGLDKPTEIVAHPNGNLVFVTGRIYDVSRGEYLVHTIAYETTTGERAWQANVPDSEKSEAIAVSPDGSSVFITGQFGFEPGTVAYDASTGEQRWVAEEFFLSVPQQREYDKGRDVVVSPDGSTVYVSAVNWRWNSMGLEWENYGDYVTLAYDADNGSRQWMARYNAGDPVLPGGDWPFAIDVAPDGSRVYVAGQSDDPVAASVLATVAYNASGPNPVIGPLVDGAT